VRPAFYELASVVPAAACAWTALAGGRSVGVGFVVRVPATVVRVKWVALAFDTHLVALAQETRIRVRDARAVYAHVASGALCIRRTGHTGVADALPVDALVALRAIRIRAARKAARAGRRQGTAGRTNQCIPEPTQRHRTTPQEWTRRQHL
jgi:hypothetical protein